MTFPTIAAALLAALALPFAAAAQAPALPSLGGTITLDQAQQVMAAAEAEARRNAWSVAIAVVENNGSLVMFKKADGVQYGSVAVSMQKARSAALFRRSTKVFADQVATGNAAVLALEGAIATEGGVPILLAGRQIGAIGVSGVTAQQDAVVAAAGAAAVR